MNYQYSPQSRFLEAQQLASILPASIAPGEVYAYRRLFRHNRREAYCHYQITEIKYITWSLNLLSNK